MIDEELRQTINEVREMKQMCGKINMKLTNIVTQRGQDWKKKLEAEYKRGLEEGYERGLAEGKKAFDLLDAERDAEYQRGLNDAWEMAKKISLMSPDEIEKVFPGAAKYNRYNLGYSGIEAIEKLKAYEEKQKADDEIKVGDEVEAKEYLIDLSYKLGTTAIEELTLKDGEKMRKAIEALEMTERSEE